MARLGLILMILCAGTAFAQAPEQVFVRIDGDTVRVFNTDAMENCACQFRVTVQTAGSTVTVIERDTCRMKADCICRFDFEAKVTGLAQGTYTAEVYREYLKRYDYPLDTLVLIGVQTFAVQAPSVPVSASAAAGPCHDLTAVDPPPHPPERDVYVRPNPARGTAVLRWISTGDAGTEVLLYDAIGRLIATIYSGEARMGVNERIIDCSSLAGGGTYHVVVRTERGIQAGTFQTLR